jgi:flagellar hook assembly protein FlgD
VRFQARLSSSLPWSVSVVDHTGKLAASGKGTGTLVDWTWRSAGARKGVYTWTISAPGIRVASGSINGGTQPPPPPPPPPKLSLTNVTVNRGVVGPAPDGTGGTTTIAFTLGGPAHVTGIATDASGVTVAQVLDENAPAGNQTVTWDASALADGRYRISLTAAVGSKHVTKSADLVVDRTLTGLQVSTTTLSPNGDGIDDTVTLSFTLTQDVPVRVDVVQAGVVLATLFQGQPGLGPHTVTWDGTANGAPVAPGRYQLAVTVTDALGDVQTPVAIAVSG